MARVTKKLQDRVTPRKNVQPATEEPASHLEFRIALYTQWQATNQNKIAALKSKIRILPLPKLESHSNEKFE